MKKAMIILAIAVTTISAPGQTVENIKVNADGDKIRITYRIGGSLEGQLYTVQLECSIDGGPRFIPESVIGDIGENISGGKSYYTVVWEVFKDLDEVGEAEFFISVIPAKMDLNTKDYGSVKRREFFAGYSGSETAPVGINGGYLGNWGFYATFRAGFDGHITLMGGATKQIFQKASYRMHGYLGLGKADYLDEFALEAGIVNVAFNRINLNLGLAVPTYFVEITFGLGVVF